MFWRLPETVIEKDLESVRNVICICIEKDNGISIYLKRNIISKFITPFFIAYVPNNRTRYSVDRVILKIQSYTLYRIIKISCVLSAVR